MYFVYIIQCKDRTLYTGITTNLDRRIEEHNNSKLGAKYTRVRRPVKLVYSKEFIDRSEASKEEARIKKLSRQEKLNLFKPNSYNLHSYYSYSSYLHSYNKVIH